MPYVIPLGTRFLKIDVLGFQQAIHQPYSTDLVPLDFVYFPNMKLYLRGTRFDHRTKIGHAILNSRDH